MYTISQKFLNSKIFNVFKEVSSAHQTCIYLIPNAAKAVIFRNIFTIYNNSFLFEYILKCKLLDTKCSKKYLGLYIVSVCFSIFCSIRH